MKFILLHLTENAPILFNVENIVTVQPEKNGNSKATGTLIVTNEFSEESLYYIVVEKFWDVIEKIKKIGGELN